MIWATDSEAWVRYVDPGWSALTGQLTGAALGRGWLAVVHPDDRDRVIAALMAATAEQSSFATQYRLRRRNGDHTKVLASAMPSFAPDRGRFLGFLGSLREIGSNHLDGAGLELDGLPFGLKPRVQVDELDLVADRLLAAHALVVSTGDDDLTRLIAVALREVGRRLAARQNKSSDGAG